MWCLSTQNHRLCCYEISTHTKGEEIWAIIVEPPETNTCKLSRMLRVSHATIWRTLHEQLYPFHMQLVQTLNTENYSRRLQLSMTVNFSMIHRFIPILFMDETKFEKRFDYKYPQWTSMRRRQSSSYDRFSISPNIFSGVTGDHLFGSKFLPDALSRH